LNTHEWTVLSSPRSTTSTGLNGWSGLYQASSKTECSASTSGAAFFTVVSSSRAQAVDASEVVGLSGQRLLTSLPRVIAKTFGRVATAAATFSQYAVRPSRMVGSSNRLALCQVSAHDGRKSKLDRCPWIRSTETVSPCSAAASIVSSRSSIAASRMIARLGWIHGQIGNTRTWSSPIPARSAKSRRTAAGS
jgi:hypothetical protein